MIIPLLLKATAILVAALLAIRLADRARASVRHAMLAAAFVVLAALPAATVILPALELPILQAPSNPTPLPAPGSAEALARAGAEASTVSRSQLSSDGEGAAFDGTNPAMSAEAVALGIWLTGATLVLLPLLVSLVRLQRLRRVALPCLDMRRHLPALAHAAGVGKAVDVVVHDDIAAPITCGIMRPAIVLPPDAPEWPEDALTRALVHELEHVKRRDWAVQLLARAVCAFYWFHPLVWIGYRQLCLQAEHACDDAVVTREEDTMYADQLVTLARRMAARPAAVAVIGMAQRSDLAARVAAVLDASRARGRAGALRASAIAAAALTLLVALAPLHLVAAVVESETPRATAAGPEEQRRNRSSRLDRVLVEAADEGDLHDVRELLDNGANVNAAVDGDGSPLIAAARGGHREIVQLLLEHGADVDLGVPGDGAPLIMAAREGHLAIVQLLLDRGANVDLIVAGDENGLIQASGAGRLDVVKLLVARGANINARVWADRGPGRSDGEWRTPLGMALNGGHRAVADFLRSAGAVE
ncbi:MAG TPA: M56 family metallopeptidase [Vicinamibacterales bacterium]|nr:M56 family metallopeptidase [Vicinamibacterales bacterium]